MRAELKTLFSYHPQDRLFFIQAWFLLLGIDLALRTLPLHRVQAWIQSLGRTKKAPGREQTDAIISRASEFVDRAARHHLYAMTCLRRSLALQWLLARSGLDTRLQYGVRRENGKLQAHAWLEYQGRSIGEKVEPTSQYSPLKVN